MDDIRLIKTSHVASKTLSFKILFV